MDFAFTAIDLDKTTAEWLKCDDYSMSSFGNTKMGYTIWSTYNDDVTLREFMAVWSRVSGFAFPDSGNLKDILANLNVAQKNSIFYLVRKYDPRTCHLVQYDS